MATVRHLVVIASADPSRTDGLADLLRDTFTVRTAYNTSEVLDRLDDEVDVVLVDPDLSGDAVDAVRETIAEADLNCRVGVLSAEPRADVAGGGAGTAVLPSAPDRELRDRVEQLATQAHYRKTLEEYYALARTSARLRESGDLADERERLQNRLERIARRLNDVAEPLDAPTLFRTALDPESED